MSGAPANLVPKPYCDTFRTKAVGMVAVAPPDEALIVMLYGPTGVPWFELPLLLPPQEASHMVENPITRINPRKRSPRKRMPRSERRRVPAVNIRPSNPGSRAA